MQLLYYDGFDLKDKFDFKKALTSLWGNTDTKQFVLN